MVGHRSRLRGAAAAFVAGVLVLSVGPSATAASEETATLIREVPGTDLSPVSVDPSGVAYMGSGQLMISDSEVDETDLFAGVNFWRTNLKYAVVDTGLSPEPVGQVEPNGLDYDPQGGRLFVSNDQTESVFILRAGPDGRFGSGDDVVVRQWDTEPLGALDISDVAYRPKDGSMFVVDFEDATVFRVRPGPNQTLDGLAPDGDDSATSFPLPMLGDGNAEGLGYRAATDTLLLTESGSEARIHELTLDGVLLRSIDISFLRKSDVALRPADIVMAPASSGAGQSMYVVDRGRDSGDPTDPDPAPADGRLYELQAPFFNLAPRVSAGPDQTITLSQSVTLRGWVVDDGQPVGAGLALQWTQVSGPPGGAMIGSPGQAQTVIGFSQTGTYTFRLRAYDGALAATDTAVVTVIGSVSGRFTDDDDSIFETEIEWLASEGITFGCNPPHNTLFCPKDKVTRGQMAAFLVRALHLPPAADDPFVDDDGSVFEGDIAALAAADVTRGCNPPANDRFCPGDDVTRGQMAAFLRRALGLAASPHDQFTDDDASVFEADIQSLAAAGITRGCNPPANTLFCPDQSVTREQMAAFLYRALADA